MTRATFDPAVHAALSSTNFSYDQLFRDTSVRPERCSLRQLAESAVPRGSTDSEHKSVDMHGLPAPTRDVKELVARHETTSGSVQPGARPSDTDCPARDSSCSWYGFSDDELQEGYVRSQQPVRGTRGDEEASGSHVVDTQGSWDPLNIVTALCPQQLRHSERWDCSHFKEDRKLGRGYLSVVLLCTHLASRVRVAVKKIEKRKCNAMHRHQVRREVRLHASLDHPHILPLYGAFEDDEAYYIIMQYASGGSVYSHLKSRGGRLPDSYAVQTVITPFLLALKYLHDRNIVHRDIKPENGVILLDGRVMLTDFGLACDLSEQVASTRLGTLDYMAPEVISVPPSEHIGQYAKHSEYHYSTAVDIWATGTLAYELLIGAPPFHCRDKEQQEREIMCKPPQFPHTVSQGAKGFINCALSKIPADRPTAESLLQHAWISSLATPNLRLCSTARLSRAASLGGIASGARQPSAAAASESGARLLRAFTTGSKDRARGAVDGEQARRRQLSQQHPEPTFRVGEACLSQTSLSGQSPDLSTSRLPKSISAHTISHMRSPPLTPGCADAVTRVQMRCKASAALNDPALRQAVRPRADAGAAQKSPMISRVEPRLRMPFQGPRADLSARKAVASPSELAMPTVSPTSAVKAPLSSACGAGVALSKEVEASTPGGRIARSTSGSFRSPFLHAPRGQASASWHPLAGRSVGENGTDSPASVCSTPDARACRPSHFPERRLTASTSGLATGTPEFQHLTRCGRAVASAELDPRHNPRSGCQFEDPIWASFSVSQTLESGNMVGGPKSASRLELSTPPTIGWDTTLSRRSARTPQACKSVLPAIAETPAGGESGASCSQTASPTPPAVASTTPIRREASVLTLLLLGNQNAAPSNSAPGAEGTPAPEQQPMAAPLRRSSPSAPNIGLCQLALAVEKDAQACLGLDGVSKRSSDLALAFATAAAPELDLTLTASHPAAPDRPWPLSIEQSCPTLLDTCTSSEGADFVEGRGRRSSAQMTTRHACAEQKDGHDILDTASKLSMQSLHRPGSSSDVEEELRVSMGSFADSDSRQRPCENGDAAELERSRESALVRSEAARNGAVQQALLCTPSLRVVAVCPKRTACKKADTCSPLAIVSGSADCCKAVPVEKAHQVTSPSRNNSGSSLRVGTLPSESGSDSQPCSVDRLSARCVPQVVPPALVELDPGHGLKKKKKKWQKRSRSSNSVNTLATVLSDTTESTDCTISCGLAAGHQLTEQIAPHAV